jgi:hypothetical protein
LTNANDSVAHSAFSVLETRNFEAGTLRIAGLDFGECRWASSSLWFEVWDKYVLSWGRLPKWWICSLEFQVCKTVFGN